MKIIFLDIDGVLTTVTWRSFQHFNPVCVNMLKSILKAGDYKIVISSTWRGSGINNNSSLDKELRASKLMDYLYLPDWYTPRLNTIRGLEIKDWLDKHPEVTDYLILDDDSDMLDEQKPFFVKTSTYDGILFEHFQQMQEIAKIKTERIILLPEWNGE